VAGIPELVVPNVSGWLVPPGSAEALTEAMRDALTSPTDRLDRMGRAGAARVAEGHNVMTEARKLAQLFRESSGLVA
jgi:glycosyltransferase involved in cell wall biosynthesis